MVAQEHPALELLLVEDNEDDIAIAQRSLAKSGVLCHLHVARDGQEALSYLSAITDGQQNSSGLLPDVIMLDLGLPRVSGLDVLRRIKAHGPLRDIPVVVITGSADDEMLRLCVGLGTSMYLVKPMTTVSAMNVILRAEKRWRALDQLRIAAA